MLTRADTNRLSTREREVLGLLAQGRQNKQIAQILGITPGTVECHMHSILKKFGVSTRLQAALLATRQDLLGDRVADEVSSKKYMESWMDMEQQ